MSDFPILLVEDDANDVFFFERAAKRAGVTAPVRTVRSGCSKDAWREPRGGARTRGPGATPHPS